jgi:hypothetical protein
MHVLRCASERASEAADLSFVVPRRTTRPEMRQTCALLLRIALPLRRGMTS